MDYFWKASVKEIKQGYFYNEKTEVYTCLICEKEFEDGIIYPMGCGLCSAKKAIELHIQEEHSSMFDYLLEMGKSYTSLTELQKQLMRMFYDGYSDKQIVEMTKANSTSTIRNQRFSFREKYKQAKVIVAMMELLEEKRENKLNGDEKLMDIHRTATMIDERYAISEAEEKEILNRYFNENNELIVKDFPAREKRKIIILKHLTKEFDREKKYSEKEVNNILKNFYDDIATIRRYLIEYGFLERTKDGKAYWVK